MAFDDTGTAIGDVSRMLQTELTNYFANYSPAVDVTVDRPQPTNAGGAQIHARLNLFLYEVQLDPGLRNISLTPDRPAPLWLVLRYVLTAFDTDGASDTAESHDVLGRAMQALLTFNNNGKLPDQTTAASLIDNPESLKVTFDDGPPELLSRLMQGPDDRFRCSMPFQIRPVLVASTDPPSAMTLVGVDYLHDKIIGLAGVQNFVLPGIGPTLDSLSPDKLQPGDTLTINGSGLGSGPLTVHFGPTELGVTMQSPAKVQCVVSSQALDPTQVSAGNLPVSVSRPLSGGLKLTSNILSGSLLPVLASATPSGMAAVSGSDPSVFGKIKLTGQFLGRTQDYVEIGLLNESGVVAILDGKDASFVLPSDQSAQQFAMQKKDAVPPGTYTLVCRVNGQQARQAALVELHV